MPKFASRKVVIVAVAFAAIVDASRRGDVAGRGGAREILDARYAGGEISREEYERVRRDLETS